MATLLEQLRQSLGSAYTIDRELGGGGMSQVFLATENRLNRKVVVKVLSPELAKSVSAERFEREIQLAAQLQQANIVPLLATGDVDGLPYFTMPFVEGESVRASIAAHGAFPINECVSILRDVARALSYAHAAGVVHRDIKPDNILLSHGAAVVTDFGIAKALSDSRRDTGGSSLTQTGTSLGSPAYMSPEQVAGDPNVDHRADIYAFGCMGYELLTGEPPFMGETPQRVLAAHLTQKPLPIAIKRSDVPRSLAAIIMRCLEKEPSDRPQSAAEILSALDSVSSSDLAAIGYRPSALGSSDSGVRRIMVAVAAVALVAVAVVTSRKFFAPKEAAAADRSVAVLPLANLSGDKADDYFGEGLAEEITGALTKAGLRVIGRSSAVMFTAKGMSPGEIARELHVANVLQGSVQRSGDRVRISVSLLSAPDESILWTDKYDRAIKDVFAVQDEIAHAVANELKVKLAGAQQLSHVDTQDPEAHTAYLQGLYLWNRRNAASLRKAISLFGEAVRLDPSYAQAYGGMAMAYVVLPAYDDVPADEMLNRAREAGNKALALDSGIVQAYTALAYVDALQYRNASSEKLFDRAIEIDSSFATAHFWHGLLFLEEAQNEKGLAEIQRARSFEPASLVINTAVTQALYDMRRYDEAEKAARGVAGLDANFQLGTIDLVRVLIESGKANEAISMLKPILDVPGVAYLEKVGLMSYAMARAGRLDDARSLLQKAEAQSSEKQSHRGIIAAAYEAVGDHERAVANLRLAINDHDLWLAHYFSAAPYDGLRKDPRVREMFATVSKRN